MGGWRAIHRKRPLNIGLIHVDNVKLKLSRQKTPNSVFTCLRSRGVEAVEAEGLEI